MENQLGQSQEHSASKQKNWIIALLALALVATWVFLLIDQQEKKGTIQKQQADITNLDAAKLRLQVAFDESLTRLDSFGNVSDSLKKKVANLQTDIDSKKAEIRRILKNSNAKEADLQKARTLIAELNDQILNLDATVARLTGENKKLRIDNAQLQADNEQLEADLNQTRTEKDDLSKTVDKGSTFVASNIQVNAIDERKSGKEKTTTKAKRVDKLMVSFDVQNRIAQSGPTEIYFILTAPDGQVVNSGTVYSFDTREEGKRSYTAKVDVNYQQGAKQNVQYPIRGAFATGTYKTEIFQNGFKIGEAERPLN